MKLYYSPGACSLACHITLAETGMPYGIERADLRSKTTETGADFAAITARGAVPALELDSGEVLTEGVAIMQFVTDRLTPDVLPAQGTLERARLQETLNFIATELHKTYGPFFGGIEGSARDAQIALLNKRLALVEARLADGREWLMGASYSPADAYLFTVTNWSAYIQHDLSAYPRLSALRARIAARPAVIAAMKAEGLIKDAA